MPSPPCATLARRQVEVRSLTTAVVPGFFCSMPSLPLVAPSLQETAAAFAKSVPQGKGLLTFSLACAIRAADAGKNFGDVVSDSPSCCQPAGDQATSLSPKT